MLAANINLLIMSRQVLVCTIRLSAPCVFVLSRWAFASVGAMCDKLSEVEMMSCCARSASLSSFVTAMFM